MDEKILATLRSIRPEADFAASSDFVRDGLLDSFDIVTLVAELDRTHGISIVGTDILPENFQNAAAIRALLRRYGVNE